MSEEEEKQGVDRKKVQRIIDDILYLMVKEDLNEEETKMVGLCILMNLDEFEKFCNDWQD